MSRTRDINSDFFLEERFEGKNPINAFIFVGLWTIADKQGRLLDKIDVIKLKFSILKHIDIEEHLNWLHENNAIIRYTKSDIGYIQIVNWEHYQKVHPRECNSRIPAFDESCVIRKVPAQYRLSTGSVPAVKSVATVATVAEEEDPFALVPSKPCNNIAKRACRLPEDWLPSAKDLAFIRERGPNLDIELIVRKFKNYWTSKAGKDATKTNWSRTWENWVLTEKERAGKGENNVNQKSFDELKYEFRKKWYDEAAGKTSQKEGNYVIDI